MILAAVVGSVGIAWSDRGVAVVLFSPDYCGGILRVSRASSGTNKATATHLVYSPTRARPEYHEPPVATHARTGAREPELGDALTAREHEVLGAIVLGQTNKEIAVALDISDHTAKFHVGNVMRKLGTRNRAATAVQAVRRGLVTEAAHTAHVDLATEDAIAVAGA